MGAEPLGRLELLQSVHATPEVEGHAGVVARLGHHHEANVVGLTLLAAAHGAAEQEIQDAVTEGPGSDGGQATGEQDGGAQQDVGADAAGHALGDVLGEVVGDLVTEDGGEPVLVPGDEEQAAVDEDLAAGQDEGVGGSVVDDPDLPLGVLHAADGDEALHDAADHLDAGVPGGQEAAALVLDLPDDAAHLLVGHGLDEVLAEAVEAPPPRHGDRLDVAEVESEGRRHGHQRYHSRPRRPRHPSHP